MPDPDSALPTKPPPPASTRRLVLFVIAGSVALVGILALALAMSMRGYVIRGRSMEPALRDGDRVFVEHITPRYGTIQRGDIVVYRHSDGTSMWLRRVIGLPGETVEIRSGKVFVDGAPLADPWTSGDPDEELPPTRVPGDGYFLLADNRPISIDSRRTGYVSRDRIVGRAIWTYWQPR